MQSDALVSPGDREGQTALRMRIREPAFSRPVKPTDNSYIESFNGRVRDECLNVHQFLSLDHVDAIIEEWRRDDNAHRRHSSIGDLTPIEFAHRPQDHVTATER